MFINFSERNRIKFSHKKNYSGFTLLELMIVVTVVAILSMFALPAYFEHVRKGDRAQAEAILLENAHALQLYHGVKNTYVGAPLSSTQSPANGSAKHNISLESSSAISFSLKAVPVKTDPECGTLTLTSTGVKGISGGSKDAMYCWKG